MSYLMVSIIMFSMLFNCAAPNGPKPAACFNNQVDSCLKNYQFDGDDSSWPLPKYRLWEHWYGTGYYRDTDSTLIAYGDTIIAPHVTGWDDSKYQNLSGTYGIRTDGMPYFLDSLRIHVTLGLSDDPLISADWVNSLPYWFPSMLPPYIKWREKDPDWMFYWGFWPEMPSSNYTRADAENFNHNIGDTVEVVIFNFPNYWMEFIENHESDSLWINSRFGFQWTSKTPDNYRGFALGVIIDRWLEPINNIRYYRVINSNGYSKDFCINKVRVTEEIKIPDCNNINWQNGGICE